MNIGRVIKVCDKPEEIETWLEDYIKEIREQAKKVDIKKVKHLSAIHLLHFENKK